MANEKEQLTTLYQDLTDVLADTHAAARRAATFGVYDIAGELVAQELRLERMLDRIAAPGTVPVRPRTNPVGIAA